MTQAEFSESLWRVVEQALEQLRMGISDSCAVGLRGLIERAVLRIREDGLPFSHGILLDTSFNLLLFVGTMAQDAKSKGLTRLEEHTLQAARLSLCPIWPFC